MIREVPDLATRRLAERVAELRAARKLSLDQLAARSGVSRAMLSRIERAESSPTAVLLERLAAGLGVTMATLFDAPGEGRAIGPLARRAEQPEWRDPGSGYLRRNVSPPLRDLPVQLVEVHFPAGARVAFEAGLRTPRMHQQVWVLGGAIVVAQGRSSHRLQEGDCLAMDLDLPAMFHNPTKKAARYAVVLARDPGGRA